MRSVAPGSRLRRLALISFPILAASVAFFELGVFRLVATVDNFPLATYDRANQILKYWSNQSGVRYPDRDRRHPVAYSINDDGWNSIHPAYPPNRNSRRRIALIGDSFVEAFQVNPAESVGARLEALLGPASDEVYSFGISGAPLSQYLHMARYVAHAWHPDAIVIVMVHNDFIESYRPKPSQFSSSFLHLVVGERVHEVLPLEYDRRPIAQWMLARSATLRFGFYVWRGLLETTATGSEAGHSSARYEANINVTELDEEEPRIQRATGYLFEQFARLERSGDARFLFVMDGPREAIYQGKDPRTLEVHRLNRIGQAAADRVGLPFVDLTEAFVQDYARHGQRFEFATDNHWNARGHDLVAHEIEKGLRQRFLAR
jgi:lysophospholipase L1-like esterase